MLHAPLALFLVWQVVTRSTAGYLANAWPEMAVHLQSTNATALGNLADEVLDRTADAYQKFMKTFEPLHRWIVSGERLTEADAFTARVLSADAKNYHTWSYRQWLLAHFNDEAEGGLWAGERAWIEALLEKDVRNNSAWHHRFFVVWASGVRRGDEDREAVCRRELA